MAGESIGRIEAIEALTKKSLWLASWMVHHANHIRPNFAGLKVGGHQASSASMAAMLATLYFGVLKPEDRLAVKPHAAPIFHAIQYLMGRQSQQKLVDFRAFGGSIPEDIREQLQAHTDAYMEKLNDLLEPEYQWMPDGKSDGWQGIDRFIPTDKG